MVYYSGLMAILVVMTLPFILYYKLERYRAYLTYSLGKMEILGASACQPTKPETADSK